MNSFLKIINDLFFSNVPLQMELINHPPNFGPDPDPATLPTPVHRKVLVITHNPVLHSQAGRTLEQYFGWNNSAHPMVSPTIGDIT